jgi:hypothetical protein
MTSSTFEVLILYSMILIGFVFTFVVAARLRHIPLRTIPAYEALAPTAGEAVESDKPIHISLGSSAVRDESTISAIAGAEVLYFIAERAAIGERPTMATTSDPVTLNLAQDALRRAYKARRVPQRFRPSQARWYPAGPRSLAFAAGVGAALKDEDMLSNVMVGRFGAELALLAENAVRLEKRIIAHSDQVDGQAVAYAISRTPLIGEELYVSAGYLRKNPLGIGGVVALDILRYLVIIGIIIAAAISFTTGGR